jgi:hypothetical protein
MLILTAVIVVLGAIIFTLAVRAKDLPAPEPESPTRHLEERKATIYENLRDLQFEYRVGKLSDADYQATKTDLQRELAVVLAEIDKLAGVMPPAPVKQERIGCASCGAHFEKPMKFCGECGAPMTVEAR